MIEICVPLPNNGEMSLETEATINTLLIMHGDVFDTHGPIHDALLCNSRNRLLARTKHDEVLFVDGDVSSDRPYDDVMALVNAHHDALVVAGGYSMRGNQSRYSATVLRDNRETYLTNNEHGVWECRWVGMGFTYLNLRELRKILPANEPWFRHEWITTEDGRRVQTSEDIGFAMFLRAHGVAVYANLDTHLIHEGVDRPITYRRSGKMEGKGNAAVAMPQQQQISVDQWAASAYKLVAQVQATIAFADDQLRTLVGENQRLAVENGRLKKELEATKSPPTEEAKDEPAGK